MSLQRPEGGKLRERTLRSVFWILAYNVLRAVVYFLAPAAIAWLTGPLELGLAQLAFGVWQVTLPVIVLGTKAAVLQCEHPTQSYLSSVFWVNLFMGALTAAVLVVGAPWIAGIGDDDPRLVTILHGMGAVCLVFSLTVVQGALLARRLEFRVLSLANIIGGVAAGVVGIVAALLGARVAVVVGGGVAAYLVVNTVALWVAGRWRPSFVFRREDAMSAVRFGVTASLGSFVFSLSVQLERFLVSGFFGQAALGLFGAARNLNRDPLRQLMRISDEVLLPGLAALQEDHARARAYYLKALRYEFLVFAPAAIFIGVFARDLVLLVYGPKWLEIVPLVQVLTPLVLFTTTRHTVSPVFLSQGRPDVQMRWSLLMVVLAGAYVIAGSPWGLFGAIAALSILEVVSWIVSHRMANALLGLTMSAFLRNLLVPMATTLVLGGVLLAARSLGGWGVAEPSWPVLAAWAAASLPVYVAVLHALDAELSRSFWRTLRDVLLRPEKAPAAG
jgi:O-antigen/teichoic acid export membrane protein